MQTKDMKVVVNPKGWRYIIASWLLSKDHIHVFNAHVVQNEDGTVTIQGHSPQRAAFRKRGAPCQLMNH